MSLLTLKPDSLKETLSFKTNIITSRNGTEQRIALRTSPRKKYAMSFLADSDEEIQYWKYALASDLGSDLWQLPLWGEAEEITSPVQVGDTTVQANFSLMDDTLGAQFLLIHPDETTLEVLFISGRTATTATRISGTFSDDFPMGSLLVPVELGYTENNSSYSAFVVNAAKMSVVVTPTRHRVPGGKGSAPITQYNGRNVLDQYPLNSGGKEVFSHSRAKLDFGGVVQIESVQDYANITSARLYKSSTNSGRQWWKSFLTSVNGPQKAFYCSTYRHDMTVTSQPAVGGTTFGVNSSSKAEGWDDTTSHRHLAISTADGAVQYKEVDPATTTDSSITITTGLVGGVAGSTILKVSFLELVRIGADNIDIEHKADNTRLIPLPLRTIQS